MSLVFFEFDIIIILLCLKKNSGSVTREATETGVSKYLFQEQPFHNALGVAICFRRTYMFFPGGSICSSNRPYYHRTDTNFPNKPSLLVLEHIRIFQEPLFFHRTDINFPGSHV